MGFCDFLDVEYVHPDNGWVLSCLLFKFEDYYELINLTKCSDHVCCLSDRSIKAILVRWLIDKFKQMWWSCMLPIWSTVTENCNKIPAK